MIRLNRWLMGGVLLIIIAALFVDTYSYTYRFLVEKKGLGQKLNANPHIGGLELYIHKGLDLSGGTELTIAICKGLNDPPGTSCRNAPPKGKSASDLQNATITVLSQRVNGLGVAEASVQAQGSDQILVQIPGVSLAKAKDVIGTTAKLHFAVPVQGQANPSDPTFLRDQQNLYDPRQLDPALGLYPAGYHWKIDDNILATDVSSATVGYDTQSASYAVDINFNSHGADEWSRITNAAYAQPQGSTLNRIAIFLDTQIISAPQVISPSSNQTQITGGFTADSANQLASQISAGALPAEIATVQATEVSATLGSQTVRQSLIAGLVGLIIVVLFMVGYYRFPGLLASLALLCYAAIVLALYKLIPVTVTLAGLAGFVLSVGMAVDANVLIFERTRDELRHGRSVPLSVEAGFRRAWPAIRDSNISTMIACVVLWVFGTDVVKGFALTLGLGVAVSMFSAILITQSLFVSVLNWRRARNPQLYTEIHEEYEANPPKGRFDIVRTRNWYFLGSLAIIIPGILAILFWGFRLGLDFAGGNRIDATLAKPATQAQVEGAVNGVAANLQPSIQAEAGNRFSIRTLPTSLEQEQLIVNKIGDEFGYAKDSKGAPIVQTQTVGPTIATDLVRKAILLVILSSILIAVYLAFRFRTQTISRTRFSVCTLFKLLHDVFVLAGIWAVIGHFSDIAEVDTLFVTAILTSVSFSIHDTIVVFDRIRENLRTGPRLTFDQVVNLSTVQTMTRSLNTALTVTFVLFALVLFGGSSIRGFVLALLIGIVTGTYSSIFNASTLLIAWQSIDREKPGAQPPGPRRVQARARAAS
ncbi:MAG TPA: protein translocase subunit SecD [Candidatus Dormibacteraeota bacterium]|nr:protein translocase subunit SecD [Candidatus Dormibacteraeota bacterium]